MVNILRSLRTHWNVQSTRRALDRLSDRQLEDLGVERGRIAAFARYCAGVGPWP